MSPAEVVREMVASGTSKTSGEELERGRGGPAKRLGSPGNASDMFEKGYVVARSPSVSQQNRTPCHSVNIVFLH